MCEGDISNTKLKHALIHFCLSNFLNFYSQSFSTLINSPSNVKKEKGYYNYLDYNICSGKYIIYDILSFVITRYYNKY